MTWKHFLHYWPFVWGIHQSPVDSPHKGPLMSNLNVFFVVGLNKLLHKQLRCQWLQNDHVECLVNTRCWKRSDSFIHIQWWKNCQLHTFLFIAQSVYHFRSHLLTWFNLLIHAQTSMVVWLKKLVQLGDGWVTGSGHEGAAVLLPGFAINW